MIYSKRNDFLFIKGRKVGGTSIEIALSTICGPDDIITPITPIDEIDRLRRGGRGAQNYSRNRSQEISYLEQLSVADGNAIGDIQPPRAIYKSHVSLQQFIEYFGSLPTTRIFCVERSPYAKIISKSVMRRKFAQYKTTGEAMSLNPRRIGAIVAAQMERGADIDAKNIDLYRGLDGKVSLKVLRQEALAEEFGNLMKEYGVSEIPALPHAKQGINSGTIDPHKVFSREQLDSINEEYAEEFETFSYQRL
jgi:hypothetical protein